MAIIKCPECGRQISDKAPVCPNCGAEIAGKVIRCTQCGEVYFNDQEFCPNCHHSTYISKQAAANDGTEQAREDTPVSHETPLSTGMPPVPPTLKSSTADGGQEPPKSGKSKKIVFIAALCIALLIGGIVFYNYHNAKEKMENEAYAFALKSDDPQVLQIYLSGNPDAPENHRTAIMARLDLLKKQDADWSNALMSDSRTALEYYIANHPDSEHNVEARHKIDSIDWADASNENTMEAMQLYLTRHPNGEHVDEANTTLKEIKAKTVQNEDKELVTTSLRRFFQSVNTRNEDKLKSSVTPVMVNFLGKQDATRDDVVTFMNKIYKEDITNMNWYLNNDYKIDKKEIGDEQYEYTVDFTAVQKIERTDNSKEKENHYHIKSIINPDGLISAMTMTKILE
ncbi:MAG: zinc-ribbon domain-containing protein [Prevotella sp.]|jgi:RNA polymerase subunit RPABC4/transcription elongation factor Spt4